MTQAEEPIVEIPEPVLDKLWQGAHLSSYHPDGDQRFKLLNYGRAVVSEAMARLTVPAFPTMLRKMWSGTEVQAWMDANVRLVTLTATITPPADPAPRNEALSALLVDHSQAASARDSDACLKARDKIYEMFRQAIVPLEGATNTHDLRQAIGEKLTDKLGEMIGTGGPMDPYDSREIDAVLDAFMPTVLGATVPRAAFDELQADRDRLLVELQRRRDVERGNVWHWQTDGDNRLESLTCPVIIQAAALRELLPQWNTGNPDIPKGKCREFILAVRRVDAKQPGGRVFVFAATYANEFTDDDNLSTRDGNAFTANGWYHTGLDMSGEFNDVYEAVGLNEGDEIVGWQHHPKWVNS